MKSLLIAGTGTGVGKTAVACGLANSARLRLMAVGVCKPVESGCREMDGQLIPEDACKLLRASQSGQPMDEACPWRFAAPLAPTVAARIAGATVDADAVVQSVLQVVEKFSMTIVEPAGGLLSPLAEGLDSLELAVRAKLPMVLVAPDRLGVINQVLLCERAIETAGAELLGIVLNRVDGRYDPAIEFNEAEIQRLAKAPILSSISFQDIAEPAPWISLESADRLLDAILSK